HLALRTADATYAYDLPDGVDTRIGEEGMSLSGGQRQRLALARAIAARPAVLLMDDPLSALDTKTEEIVTERLREVLEGTTTLIVAHRTSTVALADRVALLDGGRVVAVGTHTELMASSVRARRRAYDHPPARPGRSGAADLHRRGQPAVPAALLRAAGRADLPGQGAVRGDGDHGRHRAAGRRGRSRDHRLGHRPRPALPPGR